MFTLRSVLALSFALLFPVHPAVGVALILVLVTVSLMTRLASRRVPVVNGKDLVFVLYAVAALPPVLLNPSQGMLWARIIVYAWLITLAFQNLQHRERDVWLTFWVLYVSLVMVSSVMLFQIAPGRFDFSIERLATLDRQKGFYFTSETRVGPNIAAYAGAAAVVLALVRMRFRRGRLLLNLGAVVAPAVLLFVSGGRNAWVATALCCTLYLFYQPRGLRVRRPLALKALRLVSTALGIMFVVALVAQAVAAGQDTEAVQRLQDMVDPANDQNVKFRMTYWALAMGMVQQRPLGWGFGAFKERYGYSTHNELLGQLVGGGWAATVLFVVLLGMLWWHALRMRRDTPVADAVRFAALCFLLMTCLAMVTENITVSLMNTYMPVFWTVLGISYGLQHQGVPRSRRAPALHGAPPRHPRALRRRGMVPQS